MIGGSTRVFAVLGHPVRHSLSPAMHNAAFRALGLDAVYVALDCAASRVPAIMAALAEAGGGGNVTVPHKRAAAAAVGGLEACNTFWGDGGTLRGTNTDPDGVAHALARMEVHADSWLIVGTGGSARGCLEAARRRGASVAVRSRSVERAAGFLATAEAIGVAIAADAACDLVINATPLGLDPADPVPLSLAGLPRLHAVLDLVYAPGGTALVRAARSAGCVAADGREVLLGQGMAAFRHWFPDADPPVDVMRAAIGACLG